MKDEDIQNFNNEEDILLSLNREVCRRYKDGQSALRIALSTDLISDRDDWFEKSVLALKNEVKRHLPENDGLIKVWDKCAYIFKIIWFRIAFEESKGRDYRKIMAKRLEIEEVRLDDIKTKEPFAFTNNDDFRKYVWCLRFEKNEDCGVNGIDSHTALALRVINDLDICVTNWINPVSDNLLGGSSEGCKHLRNLLSVDSAERKDFLEFWGVFKNGICRGQPSWIDTLYKSVRRLIVGFRRKESREVGCPDQLPEISLDWNGDIIVQCPSETSYEDGTYCNHDRFRFYRPTDTKPCETWEFIDGTFDCDNRSVLLRKLRRVEFVKSDKKDVNDVLKYLVTDKESGIGIYNVRRSDTTGCGYALVNRQPIFYNDEDSVRSQRLYEGEFYKVVSIKDENVSVVAYSAESPEGTLLPLNEFAMGNVSVSNVFRVPKDTLKLKVGQLVFDIHDSRIDKLVHNSGSRIFCVRNDRGGPTGYRFFYKRDKYPICDISRIQQLWYEFDGCRHELKIITTATDCWKTPKDWLWRSKGRLIMVTDNHGERAFPVTFVDVDFSEIEENTFCLGEKRHVSLRTGDVRHEFDIGNNDVEVGIEHEGFHFRPRINREGVQLVLKGKVVALTNGCNPDVEISYDDINDYATVLTVNNPNVGDFKFFYGDMSHPFDIPLRQDGTVVFRRLMDVSLISDILPLDCMISSSSGSVYSFRIYDSKSAILEVAHGNYEKRVVVDRLAGSDDLHLQYFSSYKHHVTTNKIELAYLLSHRQDEAPRFFQLEERMLVDDPQGLGRCVQSVVAKDFFKQDIEWGTGVVAFVVERSQYCVSVQTTGFFIPAPNPMSVCLDGDILKDLRLALSERQVRQDMPMSEEDRQRLRRIENEFMSDDLQKQNVLREYISKATAVAFDMDALGSINSFCNSIRNKDGNLAWVSGFVFMAGWFVRGYLDDRGLFSNDWPFPTYWDPLLVAYRYKVPNIPASNQEVMIAKTLIYQSMESLIGDAAGYRYVNCLANEQMLVRIARIVREFTSDKSQVVLEAGTFNNGARCIFYTRGINEKEHSFGYYQFFKVLDILGEALHRWRMHPTLNEPLFEENIFPQMTLQTLREYLLLVDDIDRNVLQASWCRDLVNNKSAELYFKDNSK